MSRPRGWVRAGPIRPAPRLVLVLALTACSREPVPRVAVDTVRGPLAPATTLAAAGSGELTVAEWVAADGRVVAVPAPAPDSGAAAYLAEFAQSPDPIGSVGPYTFVKTTTYAFTCGAHGHAAMHFAVTDLDGGRAVDVVAELGGERLVAQLAPLAVEAFRARPESLGAGPFTPESVAVTAAAPRWRDGRLVIALQYTSDACYACGDGLWSSYTVSTWADAPVVPPRLQGWVDTPAEVMALLGERPPGEGGGWSGVGDTVLVWRRLDPLTTETVWLVAGRRGLRETQRRPGITVAAAGTSWTWRERRVPVRTTSCADQVERDTTP